MHWTGQGKWSFVSCCIDSERTQKEPWKCAFVFLLMKPLKRIGVQHSPLFVSIKMQHKDRHHCNIIRYMHMCYHNEQNELILLNGEIGCKVNSDWKVIQWGCYQILCVCEREREKGHSYHLSSPSLKNSISSGCIPTIQIWACVDNNRTLLPDQTSYTASSKYWNTVLL